MTPKEKAKEFYKKYYDLSPYYLIKSHAVCDEIAKTNVFTAVNLIIDELGQNTDRINYYEEVKKELEKI